MSIEVELNGKAGQLCHLAKSGQIRCPLRLHPNSEDVIVGNVFGMLKHVRPHLWLNPLLNQAIDGDPDSGRFRQVWFKDFSLRLWERQARFPPELLDFKEGRTEPDVVIEWENPPTTVWIEAKWLSPLATGTTHNDENDQVTRGIRTLLAETGHIQLKRLLEIPKRQAVWIALTKTKVEISSSGRTFVASPGCPSIQLGQLTWSDVTRIITIQSKRGGWASIGDCLASYLQAKDTLALPVPKN